MKYRKNPKNNDEISQLAFGCMRLPGNFSQSERLILDAVEAGVNYFDTAYIYPGNEILMGNIISKNNLREKIKIATKIPPYMVKSEKDIERIFKAETERLKTDYIDYYLVHMLTGISDFERFRDLGGISKLVQMKADGKILNIGFSYHGGADGYISIVDAFDWDFTMIQYNYLDEFNQAGVRGLKHAASKGIPIMIMEPLRGGKLASKLPPAASEHWNNAKPRRSPAEWALRWLYNQPEVLTVLSGMNNNDALTENIRVASECDEGCLSEEESKLFPTARELILKSTKVPCTGCGYCVPCPKGVDIPLCFSLYNDSAIEGKMKAKVYYIIRTNKHNASLCTACGKCESHCPQNIEIRKELKAVTREYERGMYKPMKAIMRRVLKQER